MAVVVVAVVVGCVVVALTPCTALSFAFFTLSLQLSTSPSSPSVKTVLTPACSGVRVSGDMMTGCCVGQICVTALSSAAVSLTLSLSSQRGSPQHYHTRHMQHSCDGVLLTVQWGAAHTLLSHTRIERMTRMNDCVVRNEILGDPLSCAIAAGWTYAITTINAIHCTVISCIRRSEQCVAQLSQQSACSLHCTAATVSQIRSRFLNLLLV